MNKVYLLLFILIAMSCGEESPKSSAIFKVSSIAGAHPSGLVLSGKNSTTGEAFQKVITTASFEKELSFGSWKFFAYTWDGATDITGNLKCSSIIENTIDQPQASISLIIDQLNCDNSNIFSTNALNTSPDPSEPWGHKISICPNGVSQGTLDGGFCSYSGLATGVKLEIFSTGEDPSANNTLTTACQSLNSGGTAYTNLKVPVVPNADVGMIYRYKFYYSPIPVNTCTGEGCCSGRMESYEVIGGQKGYLDGDLKTAYYDNFTNAVLIEEKQPLKKLEFSPKGTIAYDTCESLTVNLVDDSGSPLTSDSAFTFTPTCNSQCIFYSDASCTTSVANITFPSSVSSKTFYTKNSVTANLSFLNSGDNSEIAGDLLADVPLDFTYGDIDANFLNNIQNFYDFGDSFSPANIDSGKYVIYETKEGNRGVFYVNSVTTTSVTNDTFNFDFDTYNGGGTSLASNTGVSITACFSGSCFLDLEQSWPVVTTGTNRDLWWENLSSTLYANPQGSAKFRILGPDS